MTYASTPTWAAGLGKLDPDFGRSHGHIGGYRVCCIPDLSRVCSLSLGVPKEKVAGFTVVIVLIYIVSVSWWFQAS